MRKWIRGSMIVAIAILSGCNQQRAGDAKIGESQAESQDSLEARVDKHGAEIMASSAKAEARQWMKQPKHGFFKADSREVGKFVEGFYQAGATQVFIADVEEHDGTQYGDALLVVLPKEPGARARLFEVGGQADTAFQNDPVSDKGQKYLYYSLD